MDFGAALNALREGRRVCRSGWNGKGMWLVLVIAWDGETRALVGASHERLPFIAMKTADDKIVPWLASQTDLLATDWGVLE